MTSEKKVRLGFGLVPLPPQQPRAYNRGTPLHVWMVYCPNVDVNDGLNWPLLAAACVARDSGGLGGGQTGAPPPLLVPTHVPSGAIPWIKNTGGTNF